DVNYAALSLAGRRVKRSGLDLILGHCIARRRPGLGNRTSPLVVKRVRGAVQSELVQCAVLSGHRIGRIKALPGLVLGGVVRKAYAEAELDQVVRIAMLGGEFAEFAETDHASD